MPKLFSYGTLQQNEVQQKTFGRLLNGHADSLPRFGSAKVKIENADVIADTGMTHYDNAVYSGGEDSCVDGMVFDISDDELALADRYEKIANYVRVEVKLQSGERAWVFVDARTARDIP